MSDMRWVIDRNNVVHAGYCNSKGDQCIPYVATRMALNEAGKPALRAVKDYKEMSAHLATPDAAQNHTGPSLIKACPMCVPDEDHVL